MKTEQGIKRAIRSIRAAIEMLDRAADSLSVDDPLRKHILLNRQDIDDLQDALSSRSEN